MSTAADGAEQLDCVVVGGGIAGLVAALDLHEQGRRVAVLEAGDRPGGKILTSEIAGVRVDCGPDAFLVRQPHMADLCHRLGFGDDVLVSPQPGAARIWLRGRMRPLPAKQYLGVPLDLDALDGLISPEGIERARLDLTTPADAPEGDETAGALIRRRLGDEVMDALVGPLLGGINAGDPDHVSLRAGVPQLHAAAQFDASLVRSIPRFLQSLPRDPDKPIFSSHPDGLGTVVDEMAERLGHAVRLSAPVGAIEPDPTGSGAGWIVSTDREVLAAPTVVLATPAFVSAGLLRTVAPDAAAALDAIEYASVVVVTMAFPADAVPPFHGSGFLVPHTEGLLMSACSWASSKWGHLGATGTTFLRVSSGRIDDTRAIEMDDDALVTALLGELAVTAGVTAEPTAVRVTRWPRSFPQYRPGHLERVEAIDALLERDAPGVVVAGAGYRGLGLPAIVEANASVVARITRHLR